MKTIVCILLPLLMAVSNLEEVPKDVVKAFQKKYTDAKHVSWLYEDQLYHATFKQGDLQKSASFGRQGDWVKTVIMLDIEPLESCLGEYIDSEYSEAQVIEAHFIETSNSSKYEILIRVEEYAEVEKEGEEAESVYDFYKLSFTSTCEFISVEIHLG